MAPGAWVPCNSIPDRDLGGIKEHVENISLSASALYNTQDKRQRPGGFRNPTIFHLALFAK